MSVSSPSTSSSSSSGYQLTSLSGSSTLQVTGLSSGLDTNAIVQELMQVKQIPLNQLESQQSLLKARNTELTTLQSELEAVSNDAQAMLDPSLYDSSQSVTSSNSAFVAASATTSSGAVEGGYEVQVTALAKSAQRTFDYTPPSSDDTVTIDGQAVTITAGETAGNLAASINNNSNLDVYATVTQSGTLVLSDRATGQQSGSYIQVQDPQGSLSEVTANAYAGQNAAYSIDGTAGTSSSNTVTDAIPGVTLTMSALTGSNPVTVNVNPPAVSSSSIQGALQQFVTDYNKAITDIQTQLSTAPSTASGTPTGTLYNDQDLSDLLGTMRSAMYQTISGVSGSYTNMLAIGVSTGATTGSASVSSSSIDGDLTINAATLSSAVTSDPTAVQQVLGGWASNFASLVSAESGAGGTIDTRIQANSSQVSDIGQQISTMQASLDDQQKQLVQQFAALESALSSTQSESSWLTQQINALP